jgi:CheY-like chemotaxis protein
MCAPRSKPSWRRPISSPAIVDPRLGLYRTFQAIWQSTHLEEERSSRIRPTTEPESDRAQAACPKLTPLSRQALLLTTVEGFSPEDAGYLIEEDPSSLEPGRRSRRRDRAQTRTRVMIIEDEPLIAMDLEQIVRDLGHEVTGVAVTRDEAVALAMEDRPGLVLADIQLADDSSGIDAVKDILAEFSVPVIFITAFPERLLTGERPEPTFLITKPFQRETVKTTISQALFFDQATVPA